MRLPVETMDVSRKMRMRQKPGCLTVCSCVRSFDASSLFALRQSMMVSIKGFGLCRAMWPRAAMSWSKLGSTPGPQMNSTSASGWLRSVVMHRMIFWSAWLMNELKRWCSAYSPTVFSSWCCWWCRDWERWCTWPWPLREERLGARSGLRCPLLLVPSPGAPGDRAELAKPLAELGPAVTPCAEKAAVIESCDMMAPSRPVMTWACSLRGLVAGEFT